MGFPPPRSKAMPATFMGVPTDELMGGDRRHAPVVRAMQKYLNGYGARLHEDGIMGPRTERALQLYGLGGHTWDWSPRCYAGTPVKQTTHYTCAYCDSLVPISKSRCFNCGAPRKDL
jgi:hypothetical protein